MVDALKVLQRIKKMDLDEKRRVLADKQAMQDQLKKNRRELMEKYEEEKKFASENPLICDFGAYTENYLKKKRLLEQNIADLEQEIEKIRNVMAEVFKEQKTYSIVDRQREQKVKKKIEADEQKMVDEVGTNAYIKKHKK